MNILLLMSAIVVKSIPLLEEIASSSSRNVKRFLKGAARNLIKSFTELAFNVKNSNIELSNKDKKLARMFLASLNTLSSKSPSLAAKRRILTAKPKLAIFLSKVCLPFLKKL